MAHTSSVPLALFIIKLLSKYMPRIHLAAWTKITQPCNLQKLGHLSWEVKQIQQRHVAAMVSEIFKVLDSQESIINSFWKE